MCALFTNKRARMHAQTHSSQARRDVQLGQVQRKIARRWSHCAHVRTFDAWLGAVRYAEGKREREGGRGEGER